MQYVFIANFFSFTVLQNNPFFPLCPTAHVRVVRIHFV